ncbi:MAG TPA: LLM class flavin-dependent oxidoreductase, partial [Actinomycetota bacterium]
AYPSYESLITLAAAAAVTARIGLVTNILLGPTRNPVLLAKEAAGVDLLSGGRLTLGLGVGAREDDFEVTGQRFGDRGNRFDQALEHIHRVWKGEKVNGAQNPVGPVPVRGMVPILIGGRADAAIRRVVQWGIGYTVGGAGPDQVAPFIERVRKAWAEAGREGKPRMVGLAYFGLAPDATRRATEYLGDYYGDMGKQFAQSIPKTPEALRETVKKFEDHGFDELFLDPTSADLAEIDRAAATVL